MFNWPDKNKMDFLFFHLHFLLEIPKEVEQNIQMKLEGNEVIEGGINFKLSKKEFDANSIIHIDQIPVLYPLSNREQFYTFHEGTLVFEHDILKSAFYLLSGIQEYNSRERDHFNRFPYEYSIQKKLGITDIPVVNYYFEVIINGIVQWASYHNFNITPKEPLWEKFGLLITHDVDVIDYYTFDYLAYKAKEIMGLKRGVKAKGKLLKEFYKGLTEWLKGSKGANPAWDFEELIAWEKDLGFRSVFYFLDTDLKHQDSYYHLEDKRIVNLMRWLAEKGNEIGLHGTCRSSYSPEAMKEIYGRLSQVLHQDVYGIRQHRLMYRNPQTLKIHQGVGLKYDTSLGFAEHEGFRNSYCHPFRIFDHELNKMSDIWEFPLNVMDVTLFNYQKYNYDEAKSSVENSVNEIIKFNGLLTLLWHNGFNIEFERPGIKNFYKEMLQELANKGAKSRTGREVLNDIQLAYAG